MIDRLIRSFPLLALCAILLWVCLPFGSVTQTGELAVELGCFLALAAACATDRSRPEAVWRSVGVWVLAPGLAIACIAVVGLLQARSWPVEFVRALSPEHLALYQGAQQLLGPSGPPLATVPLSLAPSTSQSAALLLAAVAAGYLAAAFTGRERGARRWLGAALAASAVFQVFYGAQAWAARSAEIWDVEVPGVTHRLRGTFVNPNHLATYLEIALACASAWIWWGMRRARTEGTPLRWVVLLSPPLLLWLTLWTALAYTASRAGLLAAVAGMAVQLCVQGWSSRNWRSIGLGLAGLGTGLAILAIQGTQQAFGALLGTSAYSLSWNVRFRVDRVALDLWQRFPWTGTGLGSFREAFPLVQPADVPGLWDHAHNDPLELLVTTGVVGAALLGAGLAILLSRLGAVLRRGRRSEDRAAALAAFGALSATGVHAVFDFGLQMPASAVTLAIVCGAASAAALNPPQTPG